MVHLKPKRILKGIVFIVVLRGFRFYKGVAGNRVGAHLRGGAAALELGAKPETRAFRAGSEVRDCWGLGFRVYWALEYHTLILFSKRNHYEIKVYTFFPWLLKSPVNQHGR